ncbi:GumC family protein [Eudoraea chungangensis]|uniref:GumC family protein n=1 Tax=Eudoraea chungangensis TaxID=1481905 RepID=UPI0023EB15E1|nr:polysaccharide biosynthesis tyrosine autokinase [Eudoraea chungangensis]
MENSSVLSSLQEIDEPSTLTEMLAKYLRFWPFFLISIIISLLLGLAYMRYAPTTYLSVAKIKIVDESKELNVASDAMALLNGTSKINLDNEIEVLKSYRLLSQVVEDLHLDIGYFEVGNIKTAQVWNAPFTAIKTVEEDSLKIKKVLRITVENPNLIITDENDFTRVINLNSVGDSIQGLPISLVIPEEIAIEKYEGLTYEVVINPFKRAVLQLQLALGIREAKKRSEILTLSIKGESVERSEAILNTLITKFNEDGILDRQLVSRRTMEVIDKRFVDLASELDSIEVGKQDFKQTNRLSYIEADAGVTLQRKSEVEDEVALLENQISLSKLLKTTVINQAEYSLLPADIGLENQSLNALVAGYNELALERDKLLPNVGINHPRLRAISGQLERGKVNIIKSVNIYQAQLRTSLSQLSLEYSRAGAVFSELPEQEKMLRSIERQQTIKEQLYLLLLQKREEAAINLATTTPSIKVVDYSLTDSKPISPKKLIVYPLSLILGFVIPFFALYIKFSLDTKIHGRRDIEKVSPEIPLLGEIPFLKKNKSIKGLHDRSILAESFRMLSTNVNYHLPPKEKNKGQVIYVNSAIKGEGKTLISINLAMAFSSLKKRVLLVGGDLRNPQLHKQLDILKKSKGLPEFLSDQSMNWQDVINEGFVNDVNIKVCYSRQIPPNAAELLAGDGFLNFLKAVKKEFDYIIVDTAPSLLVTDTLLISKHADLTLFVLRAGFTDKKLLEYSKDLATKGRVNHMAYVLNDVGYGNAKHYNYGHGYGYGSENKKG